MGNNKIIRLLEILIDSIQNLCSAQSYGERMPQYMGKSLNRADELLDEARSLLNELE